MKWKEEGGGEEQREDPGRGGAAAGQGEVGTAAKRQVFPQLVMI